MIPVKKAAKLYHTDEPEVLKWIETYQLTHSQIGETLLVEEEAIKQVIRYNTAVGRYDEYLNEMRLIREEEISTLISQLDDRIYFFKSLDKISPLIRAFADETVALIPNELQRNVYKEITKYNLISDVGKRYNLNFKETCCVYNSAINFIQKKMGFIARYRRNLAENRFERRNLMNKVEEQQEEIAFLSSLVNIDWQTVEYKRKKIPERDIEYLITPITAFFDLDSRTASCFMEFDIVTVGDLLIFLKNNSLNDLKRVRNFGKTSLGILKKNLLKHGIIDKNGHSPMFEFL